MTTAIDLGTKTGGALEHFLRRWPLFLSAKPRPGDCLGVDLRDRHRAAVEAKGFGFRAADVLDGFDWPKADVYLAFDFLEHLPSEADGLVVVRRMARSARTGVWIKAPNFEPVPQLAGLGCRLAWTTWGCHSNRGGHAAMVGTLRDAGWLVEVFREKRIEHTSHPDVVPLSAPPETLKSDGTGKIAAEVFPPAVGQWGIVARRPR